MTTISGHSFIEEHLPEAPEVLDVGSRNYDFARGILEICPKARVVCIEPDFVVPSPKDSRIERVRRALVGDARVRDEYRSFSTGEGNHLAGDTRLTKYPDWQTYQVDCLRLEDLPQTHWDLVKLDCEGSEFGVLENWPASVTADQISVEFHDYMDREKWNRRYFNELFFKLADRFEVVQHQDSKQGEAWGHWNTLLVRRDR